MTHHLVTVPMIRPRVNVENVNAAALTPVPCVALDREGVWFEEGLRPEDEVAVREWLTSRDDAEMASRAWLRALDSTDLLNGFDILRAWVLGDPLPAPVYPPPPEPEPEPTPDPEPEPEPAPG